MKIENTLVHYLLLKRVLILQGLGTFYINDNVHITSDVHTEVVLPPDSVRFEYDPKIGEDDDLVNYIVKETKKIKPLVSADLDSYIMLGKQFLNIGKPFIIPGLGTLDKTQAVELQFIPGEYITPKISAPKALKANENEISSGLFQDHQRKLPANYDRRILGVIATVIVLLGIGWAVYYFAFKKDKTVLLTSPITDSTDIKKDSVASHTADTVKTITAPISELKDTLSKKGFNIIINEDLRKEIATRKYKLLTKIGHPVILNTSDSIRYSLEEHYDLPLTDTTRITDSLKRFYGSKISVAPTK